MTVEQLLIAGIGSVSSVVGIVCKILWKKSEKCEADRDYLRKEVEDIKIQYGITAGKLSIYERCFKSDCPFVGVPKEKALSAPSTPS